MTILPPDHRPATLDDAHVLAELVNMAGEGLPLYVWSGLATGNESPWDVGRSRARREEGGFSYRNAVVRKVENKVAACLVGYPLADDPTPADYSGMPPMFVPLQQLEDEVPGTWYVNVLATYPEHRGKGFGGQLLGIAEDLAREDGKSGLSVIVSDANTGARRLYERHGYREYGTRPMVKEKWENAGLNWVLLTRVL